MLIHTLCNLCSVHYITLTDRGKRLRRNRKDILLCRNNSSTYTDASAYLSESDSEDSCYSYSAITTPYVVPEPTVEAFADENVPVPPLEDPEPNQLVTRSGRIVNRPPYLNEYDTEDTS